MQPYVQREKRKRYTICLDETVDRFSGKHLPEAREGEKTKGLAELRLEKPRKWKKIGGFGEESENEEEMGEVVELERPSEGRSWLIGVVILKLFFSLFFFFFFSSPLIFLCSFSLLFFLFFFIFSFSFYMKSENKKIKKGFSFLDICLFFHFYFI